MEMHLRSRAFKSLAVVVIAASGLTACNAAKTLQPSETLTQGYVMDQQALELVPVGSSREQVLLALGTPSTTATFDNEVFYYISQKRTRPAMFMKQKLVDQSVLAVYFDEEGTVKQIANYTLKDGRVFDMISRTTPTGGVDKSFLAQVMSGATSSESAANAARNIFGGNN